MHKHVHLHLFDLLGCQSVLQLCHGNNGFTILCTYQVDYFNFFLSTLFFFFGSFFTPWVPSVYASYGKYTVTQLAKCAISFLNSQVFIKQQQGIYVPGYQWVTRWRQVSFRHRDSCLKMRTGKDDLQIHALQIHAERLGERLRQTAGRGGTAACGEAEHPRCDPAHGGAGGCTVASRQIKQE